MMTLPLLDDAHVRYLTSHYLGRLATVAPDGTPQNKPVGYRYNAETGTIDIAGWNMEGSAKYRNIATHPDVAFVVDDAVGEGAAGMRFLEVRGLAEQVAVAAADAARQGGAGLGSHIIRIHPRRAVSWNVDPQRPGLQQARLRSGPLPG
jgi:pyridoxamine 5'-phosphate oxidase family protein